MTLFQMSFNQTTEVDRVVEKETKQILPTEWGVENMCNQEDRLKKMIEELTKKIREKRSSKGYLMFGFEIWGCLFCFYFPNLIFDFQSN